MLLAAEAPVGGQFVMHALWAAPWTRHTDQWSLGAVVERLAQAVDRIVASVCVNVLPVYNIAVCAAATVCSQACFV